MSNMQIGDKVRNINEPTMKGTLVYSSFGVSVTGRTDCGGHWQSLGEPLSEVAKHWEKDVDDNEKD